MTYDDVINATFDWCVWLLEAVAPRIGMTYNEINIWLFVIAPPIIGIGFVLYIRHLRKKLYRAHRLLLGQGIDK